MKKSVVILFFFVLINIVSGQVIIEELEDVYNIGDSIDLNFSIQEQNKILGYVECYLDCGKRLLVYKKYQLIEEGRKQSFNLSFPASIEGDCNVEIIFLDQEEESPEFEITNLIDIEYSLNNKFFFPLERVIINGTAIKKSGEQLNGKAKISLGEESKVVEVSEGEFSTEIEIRKDLLPGNYSLKIGVSEEHGEFINYGERVSRVVVRSKPSKILIQTQESFIPSLNHSSKISLLDQAGELAKNESVIVKLFDPSGKVVYEEKVRSGENFNYFFKDDATRGAWNVHAYYGNVFTLKPVYVEDNEKIDLEIVSYDNGTYLKVKNIGNIVYNGALSVILDNSSSRKKELISVGLDPGKEELYFMDYEGYYNLSAGEKNFSNVYFPTGAAISSDLKISLKSYFIFFILLLVILFLYFLSRKRKKLGEIIKKAKIRNPKKGEGAKEMFMIFFKFDKYFDEIGEIIEKNNFSISKVGDNLYYVLFYPSHVKDPEISAYRLAKMVRNKCLSKALGVSIVINFSDSRKEGCLKDFSLRTRKMVEHAGGRILVCEDIFKKLRVPAQKSIVFKGKEKTTRMYKI